MTKQRKEIQKKSDKSPQKPKQSEIIDNDELYQDELNNEVKESNGVKVTLRQLKKKSPEELQAEAESLGIENVSSLLKQELVFSVLKKIVEQGGQISGEGVLE